MNDKFFLLQSKSFSCLCICVGILISISGCQSSSGGGNSPTPNEYDLNRPFKMELPSNLDEISGIVFYAKDTSIFAISDESGMLYKVFLHNKKNDQKWKFGKNDDYEDLQLVDSTFYVLSSSGDIVRIKFDSTGSLQVDRFKFPGSGKNEFESMFYDKKSSTLNILCKDCEEDKKSSLSLWVFNIKDTSYTLSDHTFDLSSLATESGSEKVRLKPSAAALNPLTNELFIVSAIHKTLLIADSTGTINHVYQLDPSLYKQPEGIAFTPSGDLLISNEAAGSGTATILVCKLKKTIK